MGYDGRGVKVCGEIERGIDSCYITSVSVVKGSPGEVMGQDHVNDVKSVKRLNPINGCRNITRIQALGNPMYALIAWLRGSVKRAFLNEEKG